MGTSEALPKTAGPRDHHRTFHETSLVRTGRGRTERACEQCIEKCRPAREQITPRISKEAGLELDIRVEADLLALTALLFGYNHASAMITPRVPRRVGREAEGGGLLNRYRVKSSIEGSNPSLSARQTSLELSVELFKHFRPKSSIESSYDCPPPDSLADTISAAKNAEIAAFFRFSINDY